MQNSLQLKILQDGGVVGDRQLQWLSRPVFVAHEVPQRLEDRSVNLDLVLAELLVELFVGARWKSLP
jgi:hypothetical protein